MFTYLEAFPSSPDTREFLASMVGKCQLADYRLSLSSGGGLVMFLGRLRTLFHDFWFRNLLDSSALDYASSYVAIQHSAEVD